MKVTPTVKVKVGEYGFNWTITINQSSGTAKNLTGYTGSLFVWEDGATAISFSGAITITDAANGICTYSVAVTDLAGDGMYIGEIELYKTGIREITEDFEIYIARRHPT